MSRLYSQALAGGCPTPDRKRVVTAISLWEPWASLMRTGAKTIETRHWPIRHRGPLLICAAARKVKSEIETILLDPEMQGGLERRLSDSFLPVTLARRVSIDHLLFGMAVALVTVTDCRRVESLRINEIEPEQELGDYSPGRFGWMTRDLRRFKPFPVTGRQGLFKVALPLDLDIEGADGPG